MKYIFIMFLTLTLSFPSLAEENRSAMRFTTMGADDDKPPEKKHLHIRRIAPIPQIAEEKPEKQEDQTFQRVWEKYRGLAAGEGESPNKAKPSDAKPAETTPPEPASTSMERDAGPPVGLQGILANYYKNKEKRGQMQSRALTPPQKGAK